MAFLNWCKRYVSFLFVGVIALAIYVVFFNENSYSHLTELEKQIDALKTEIKQNQDTLQYYRDLNRLLNSSPDEMERIARERYFMQGPNEDVYVVERL